MSPSPPDESADRTLFGGEAPPAVAPDCLPVFFALYKFYFYHGQLAKAEHATRLALESAARQSGIAGDWRQLSPASADWADIAGPQHFYLFSLKALAFIALRQGQAKLSAALLAKLAELDPRDSVGASVIRDIAQASQEP